MVASPPLHRARRQRMSFIESRIEASARSSLPQIAPDAQRHVAVGGRSNVIDSRLITNGLDDGRAARRERVWCIDITTSPAALRGRRVPIYIRLTWVHKRACCSTARSGLRRSDCLLRSERIRVNAHMDNALSFDGLPIAPLGACRPSVHSDSPESASPAAATPAAFQVSSNHVSSIHASSVSFQK